MNGFLAKYRHLKHSVYKVVYQDQEKLGWYNKFIAGIIILNTIVFILETEKTIYDDFKSLFHIFNDIVLIIYIIDYFLILWVCNYNKEYKGWFWGRLRYLISPFAIIDLLAIFPFHLFSTSKYLVNTSLIRVIRLIKLIRYINAFKLIMKIIKSKRELLASTLSIIMFLLVITSSIVYYAENPVQPKVFSSILTTMWWGIITFGTVGYGDMYPITPLGKFIGGIVIILGIGLFALPGSILASGFIEHAIKHFKEIEA